MAHTTQHGPPVCRPISTDDADTTLLPVHDDRDVTRVRAKRWDRSAGATKKGRVMIDGADGRGMCFNLPLILLPAANIRPAGPPQHPTPHRNDRCEAAGWLESYPPGWVPPSGEKGGLGGRTVIDGSDMKLAASHVSAPGHELIRPSTIANWPGGTRQSSGYTPPSRLHPMI
jgi:hypothetical protein